MANIVSPNLPANLPTNWTNTQYISANGSEVGLSAQHGYNYLMEQVNAAQGAVNTLATQAQADLSGLQSQVDKATQDIEQLQSSSANATASIAGNTFAITGPAGQFLKKASGTNYDTQWATITAANVGAVAASGGSFTGAVNLQSAKITGSPMWLPQR